MATKTEYPSRMLAAVLLFLPSLMTLYSAFAPGRSIAPIALGDSLFLAWVMIHIALALRFLLADHAQPLTRQEIGGTGETLFFPGLLLFLFVYIFASNANMDYVQRFVATGGNLQLAPDTRTERMMALTRFTPLLLADLGLWIAGETRRGVLRAAPALTVLSVVLSVLAVPSFVSIDGFSLLGWVSLVPLFVVIRMEVDGGFPGRAVWYGLLFGVFHTLIGNFWLGTFNLISLQAVGVIFLGFYLLFMPVAVALLRLVPSGWPRMLVLPFSWTVFELARSSGFLGYPWLLTAHSQYRNVVLLQVAELGGVWLVSLVVLVSNALIAEAVRAYVGGRVHGVNALDGDEGLTQRGRGARLLTHRGRGARLLTHRGRAALLAACVVVLGAHAAGFVLLQRDLPARDTVRLALVQQNSDPRKHDYRATLDALMRITDQTLRYYPDMVVWSETAFVPNIRRWSQEDPDRFELARLAREFLAYQDSIDRWLVTGNDDYERVLDDNGREVGRNNFNAAVLFSDTGERRETYHKIKLVPFTEYFPYEKELPWVHQMLLDFDVAFWTPGDERTILSHPQFRFATPICFEDVFPDEVRQFAREGMEVIVNLTNDYWSLQEVAAQQHFVAALFRTVELRRPMVRSTASGVTSHVDAHGRIVATVPQYSEQYLIADVAVPAAGPDGRGPQTLYLRWGDWVPRVLALLLLAGALWGVVWRRTGRS